MDESNLDDLRKELASLEATEARISAERRRLHEQIDFGYASEATRAREREVSDERRELHKRIDELRELLGEGDEATAAPEPAGGLLSQWTGVSADLAADDRHAEELEL
jgi:septal ring factor EnvC (AmiA/AmiB activator)